MKEFVFINKKTKETTALSTENLVAMYITRVDTYFNHDEQLIKGKGFNDFDSIYVLAYKNIEPLIFNTDCIITFS